MRSKSILVAAALSALWIGSTTRSAEAYCTFGPYNVSSPYFRVSTNVTSLGFGTDVVHKAARNAAHILNVDAQRVFRIQSSGTTTAVVNDTTDGIIFIRAGNVFDICGISDRPWCVRTTTRRGKIIDAEIILDTASAWGMLSGDETVAADLTGALVQGFAIAMGLKMPVTCGSTNPSVLTTYDDSRARYAYADDVAGLATLYTTRTAVLNFRESTDGGGTWATHAPALPSITTSVGPKTNSDWPGIVEMVAHTGASFGALRLSWNNGGSWTTTTLSPSCASNVYWRPVGIVDGGDCYVAAWSGCDSPSSANRRDVYAVSSDAVNWTQGWSGVIPENTAGHGGSITYDPLTGYYLRVRQFAHQAAIEFALVDCDGGQPVTTALPFDYGIQSFQDVAILCAPTSGYNCIAVWNDAGANHLYNGMYWARFYFNPSTWPYVIFSPAGFQSTGIWGFQDPTVTYDPDSSAPWKLSFSQDNTYIYVYEHANADGGAWSFKALLPASNGALDVALGNSYEGGNASITLLSAER